MNLIQIYIIKKKQKIKIIDNCIQLKILKNNINEKKKIKNYQNYSLLKQSHKSLYTLSRYNNKILSQSPNKINENDLTFVNQYFTEKNNPINSKSNRSININNKSSNSKNLSNINLNHKTIKNFIINEIKKNENNSSYDLLSKIKDSLEDDLKGMFNFSYEYFLNQESERFEKK